MSPPITDRLAGILGTDAVVSTQQLEPYAIDGVVPQSVVAPVSRQALAEVMRWASEEEHALFLTGGRTQMTVGNVPHKVDVVVDIRRVHRVLDHQPADLTATFEAGITLGAVREELAGRGQFLPIEAPLADQATLGGILAANSSGPLRTSYGLPRDWLIGTTVVNVHGEEIKSGGKVVKNVTGYDLNKLYVGSFGTLGAIVEATFKLSPLPQASAVVLASFESINTAITAGQHLLGQVFTPQGIQVLDMPSALRMPNYPGLRANIPDQATLTPAVLFGFFAGRPSAVRRRVTETTKLLGEKRASQVESLENDAAWSMLKSLTDFGWEDGTLPYLSLKLNVPASSVIQVVDRSLAPTPEGPVPGLVADLGFGNMRLFWWRETAEDDMVLDAVARIRAIARSVGGSAVVEHCPLSIKAGIDVWGEPPQGFAVMRSIKQRFDPQNILSPGRFVGGL